MMDSEYKSEGEEEYTMKKMVNATKKRNQSEDIKIDYPGLSNMKQRYDELDEKYRNDNKERNREKNRGFERRRKETKNGKKRRNNE